MVVPDSWQWTQLEAGVGFAVPPDARRDRAVTVDSSAGYFDGSGYRITYDLGRFGEQLDDYDREVGFVRTETRLQGRPVSEVRFAPSDEDFGWARIVQVDVGAGRTLTLRVSCESRRCCDFAQQVFESIAIE